LEQWNATVSEYSEQLSLVRSNMPAFGRMSLEVASYLMNSSFYSIALCTAEATDVVGYHSGQYVGKGGSCKRRQIPDASPNAAPALMQGVHHVSLISSLLHSGHRTADLTQRETEHIGKKTVSLEVSFEKDSSMPPQSSYLRSIRLYIQFTGLVHFSEISEQLPH
jgi:hypothetical protein